MLRPPRTRFCPFRSMAMGLAYACAARYLNIYAAFERPLCTHSCVWRLQLLKRNADQLTTSVISKFLFVRIHYCPPSFAFDTISSIQFQFRHAQGLPLAMSGSGARHSSSLAVQSVVFGFRAVVGPRLAHSTYLRYIIFLSSASCPAAYDSFGF